MRVGRDRSMVQWIMDSPTPELDKRAGLCYHTPARGPVGADRSGPGYLSCMLPSRHRVPHSGRKGGAEYDISRPTDVAAYCVGGRCSNSVAASPGWRFRT